MFGVLGLEVTFRCFWIGGIDFVELKDPNHLEDVVVGLRGNGVRIPGLEDLCF